jgi:hypothetical protein
MYATFELFEASILRIVPQGARQLYQRGDHRKILVANALTAPEGEPCRAHR